MIGVRVASRYVTASAVVSGKVINLCPESRKDTVIGLVMRVKLHKE